ncbi:MBL fold metallo-hydrolase [uncultured Paracoccus sp.]|uniref:MBL fold metallo-hydrolase n=1 Tax=uncultured Paracoccus sp. TaxID=189685 RepID=UPI0026181173|nr:MBL fold metallo-hydrolase [uncultured Paracoccus sp.]
MAEQIPLSDGAVALQPELDAARNDHTHEVAPDLAYRRIALVNVVFWGPAGAGDREWVLIDTGLKGSAPLIRSAVLARFGERSRPAAIIVTHGHFDHVGALEQLAEEWDVPVFAHPLEHPYLDGRAGYPPPDPGVGGGLLARLAGLYPTSPVNVARRLRALPEDGSVPSMPGWQWIHVPGHSVGQIALWREADRALLAADAFCTTGQESAYDVAVQEPQMHGPPMYFTIDWEAAEESVRKLAALEPELAISFHGQPMRGPEMRAALHQLARTFRSVALPGQGRYLAEPRRAEDGSAYEPT